MRDSVRPSLEAVSKSSLEPWMLGNPKITNLDYEQDKITPLYHYLRTVSTEEGKKTVDAFVEFNKFLVKSALIDKNFYITSNFGRDAAGRVVLTDLGELITDATHIQSQIQKRIWSAPHVREYLPTNLRSYFVEKMDEAFT